MSAQLVHALAFALLLSCCSDSSATGGEGGQGAAGGASTSTGGAPFGGGGSGGEPASGGAGGSIQPACTLSGEGCDDGEKCSIVDEMAGIPNGLGCVDAGSGIAFSACDADTACGPGLWCDYTTSVCKPLCGVDGFACEGANACVVGRNSAGTPITGLNLCVASCDPRSANVNPCADDPATTCFFRTDVDSFDCGLSGNGTWISSCDSSRDCRYGLGCFDGHCQDWCGPVDSLCYGTKADGTWFCDQFKPCGTCQPTRFEHDGAQLGACTAWGQ
ncbi:MAG: hypothetical protein HOW73_29580 [Polyangiaceae bacterium]|nr:hypothetical protein [Polyangiaceae bacterium]